MRDPVGGQSLALPGSDLCQGFYWGAQGSLSVSQWTKWRDGVHWRLHVSGGPMGPWFPFSGYVGGGCNLAPGEGKKGGMWETPLEKNPPLVSHDTESLDLLCPSPSSSSAPLSSETVFRHCPWGEGGSGSRTSAPKQALPWCQVTPSPFSSLGFLFLRILVLSGLVAASAGDGAPGGGKLPIEGPLLSPVASDSQLDPLWLAGHIVQRPIEIVRAPRFGFRVSKSEKVESRVEEKVQFQSPKNFQSPRTKVQFQSFKFKRAKS